MLDLTRYGAYRMPAEWERQKSTWIAWPHNKKDWPGKFKNIPNVFAYITSSLSKVQLVNILVNNKSDHGQVVAILKKFSTNFNNIRLIYCKTDRSWTRDSLPIFLKLKNGKKILSKWQFNAWAKYKNFKKDNRAYLKIKKKTKFKVIKPKYKNRKIVLEGGSVDVNGNGLLMTTKQCLISKIQERNRGFNTEDYEKIFKKFLGINKTIWLSNGIEGDDTHGHIDDIARFVSKNKIFIAKENNKNEKNFKSLNENIQILENFKRENRKKLKIIYIPMPKPKKINGTRVPASYLNFYIANKIVLVPTFKDTKDKIVLKIFKRHFKNRKIIPIDCSVLVWGFGTIHCLTQQEPS